LKKIIYETMQRGGRDRDGVVESIDEDETNNFAFTLVSILTLLQATPRSSIFSTLADKYAAILLSLRCTVCKNCVY
jgi:hypothetical protein